jgi:hypothetical protein
MRAYERPVASSNYEQIDMAESESERGGWGAVVAAVGVEEGLGEGGRGRGDTLFICFDYGWLE